MADVKDILGLHSNQSQREPSHRAPSPKTSSSSKKKYSLPRELQGLRDSGAWDDAETMMPAMRHNFKKKRTKAISWKYLPIKSSARSTPGQSKGAADLLHVCHWVKVHDAPDYRFARFNKQVKLTTYTDEEYTKFLQDPTWTRKQTDRLFELCQSYDLRFVVIHDRFVCPGPHDIEGIQFLEEEEREMKGNTADVIISVKKTVEDLKDRFYGIQKALLTARNSSDPDLERHAMFIDQYDAQHETERKAQLARLFSRTKDEVTEMAQLVIENRNLTAAIKAMKRKDKHKGEKGRRESALAAIPDSCVCKIDTKPRGPGLALKSDDLAAALANSGRQNAKQLESELANLGLKKGRTFATPTRSVKSAYHKLQCDIVTYLNLQRYVAKKETERETRAARTSSSSSGTPSAKKKTLSSKKRLMSPSGEVKRQKVSR